MEKRERKNKRGSGAWCFVLSVLLWGIGGLGCGLILVQTLPSLRLPALLLMIALMYVGVFAQLVAHEAGHLIFGLFSGYRFSSFRIGSLMLVKTPEGLRWRRMTLAGTGGQCLLIPPPPRKDGGIPCIRYNLGGCIVNLLLSALLVLLGLLTAGPLRALLWMTALMGFVSALQNGIPMRLNGVDNDGRNARSLHRNAAACRLFAAQLECNARSVAGERLRDMPEALFQLPPEADMENPMVLSALAFAAQRVMDRGDWSAALAAMEPLLDMPRLLGVYRSMLRCDGAVCALLLDQTERAEALLEGREQKKFMKGMRRFPSVLRTEYAMALLADGDTARAQSAASRLEKVLVRHPNPGDTASERALMAEIERHWQERTNVLSENRN